MLNVSTDILLAVGAQDLCAVVLLDSSAAYDTVQLGILLHRLDSSYCGNSLTMVSIKPVKLATARASKIILFITLLHGVRCPPGFCPWTLNCLPFVDQKTLTL